ncbi:MAG: COX15/CtaA family protein [Actinomycetota bacterium]|nr:COX15/CtaA family protein [Actinomycetota bacterium]
MGVSDTLMSPDRLVLKRFAIATLVANIVIVVTGSAVRLTGSGLGCPTWPRCSSESFVVQDALGVHGVIEFGNRLLTFVLVAIAVATWSVTMRHRPRRASLRRIATVLAVGIPAQAVLGGVTVLTDLNHYVVALHLLLSLAMIGVAVVFLRRIDEEDRTPQPTVPRPVVVLTRVLFGVTWTVLYVGTVVTGSGPHAGDADSPRTGLRPAAVSQVHAELVFLLVGLTVGALVAFSVTGAPQRAVRAVRWLLAIELLQGLVGFVQYFTDLPIVLVGLHVLGAALVSAAATWVLLGIRDRGYRSPHCDDATTS